MIIESLSPVRKYIVDESLELNEVSNSVFYTVKMKNNKHTKTFMSQFEINSPFIDSESNQVTLVYFSFNDSRCKTAMYEFRILPAVNGEPIHFYANN
jgi:hypothetical protein